MVHANLLFPKTLGSEATLRRHRALQRRASRQTPAAKLRAADAAARWYYRNPDKVREKRVAYLYGLSREAYQQLLASQGGVCAICQNPEAQRHPRHGTSKSLSVDHSHETGRTRGLLCSACNTAVGLFQENPVLLDRAVKYLQTWASSQNEQVG